MRAPATLAAVWLTAAIASPAHAAMTSAYSDLDTLEGMSRCETLDGSGDDDPVGWALRRCAGHGSIDIYVHSYDGRDTARVGRGGVGIPFLPPFTHLGPKAEWRLTDGVPTAMILRMHLNAGDEAQTKVQWLTVHKVDAATGSGCIYAYVDTSRNRRANETARALADEAASRECPDEPVFATPTGEMMEALLPRLVAGVARERKQRDEEARTETAQPRPEKSAGKDERFLAPSEHGGLDVSIAPEDCDGTHNDGFAGSLDWATCANLYVARVAGHVAIGVQKPQSLIRAIPDTYEIDDTVRLVTRDGRTVLGAIHGFRIVRPGRPAIPVWQIIRAGRDGHASCVIGYGPGTVDAMGTHRNVDPASTPRQGVDYARDQLTRSLKTMDTCGEPWVTTYSVGPQDPEAAKAFRGLMGVLNAQFSP